VQHEFVCAGQLQEFAQLARHGGVRQATEGRGVNNMRGGDLVAEGSQRNSATIEVILFFAAQKAGIRPIVMEAGFAGGSRKLFKKNSL
jgi:hypothetical protein